SISIFCVLLMWAVLEKPSPKRRILWGLVVSLIICVLIMILVIGPGRLVDILRAPAGMTSLGSLDTLAFRQEVWRWAATAISDFPFTGCGLGTFRRVVTLLYPLNVPLPDIAHAHNIFLQVALDIGIPGLIAYLALLGLMVKTALHVAKNEAYRGLAIGLICGTIALHTYGLLDALALGSKPAIAFWYSLGLLGALDRLVRSALAATPGQETAPADM
ncbi:MAG: O-antigen ligase family protein, partial [Anaerolineae bacterium]|nr:O-antigen ligase family protein [Anaerolineae bacterium]